MAILITVERLSERGVPEGDRLICSDILTDEWNDLRSLQTFVEHGVWMNKLYYSHPKIILRLCYSSLYTK